jgi:hypothetical protein
MAEGGSHGVQGSRRPRQQTRRCHRVEFTLTEQEFAALEDAAKRTELARGGYAAQFVLAHVNGSGTGPEAPVGRRCWSWCARPGWPARLGSSSTRR